MRGFLGALIRNEPAATDPVDRMGPDGSELGNEILRRLLGPSAEP